MAVKSITEGTNELEETSVTRSPNLPAYLCFPTPELRGSKLFKYRLNWYFRRNLPKWCLYPFKSNQFAKRGRSVRLQEALTMDFISKNTTIPVPRVLDVFSYQGRIYIIQERIHGPVLEDVWHRLSAEERQSCFVQIKDCLDQLRALKPPHPGRVEAVNGSSLINFAVNNNEWGPFDNHDQFHHFLNYDVIPQMPNDFPGLQEPLAKVAGKKYQSVFSHGDFGPHNIMWRNGKIVVIDWECAGWLPEYWDYTRAWVARGDFKEWWDMFDEVVKRYDDELEVQKRMCDYFVMA